MVIKFFLGIQNLETNIEIRFYYLKSIKLLIIRKSNLIKNYIKMKILFDL